MKQALVIYNPVSGSRKWRDIPALIQETLLKHGYEWSWHDTSPKQNLAPLFDYPFDRIIVSGGDGTVAEVVKVLIQKEIKTPLVILPQGSGNLLARALDISLLSVRSALETGLKHDGQFLDVMRVNQKNYGMVAVGRGYDAFLMQETSRSLKRKLGLFAYAWIFLKTFLFYRAKPYKLTLDGKRVQVLANLIMVFNILPVPYTKVSPNDGLLNTFVLTSKGKLLTFSSRSVVIKARSEFKYQVDGEVCKGKVVNIEALPKAISVVFKKKF